MIQNVSSIQLLNNILKIFHNYFVTMKKVLGVQNYLGECNHIKNGLTIREV